MKPGFDAHTQYRRAHALALALKATLRVDRFGITVDVPGEPRFHATALGAVIAELEAISTLRMYCLSCSTVVRAAREDGAVRCTRCKRALSPSRLNGR